MWAGICRREALGTRRLRRAIGASNVAILPDLERLATNVRARGPELVVSWFWTRKVPAAFRTIAPLGTIGVHPSLLPRHRGPDPYFWAIDSGDTVTGVTAHVLDDEYDTGAILARRELAIAPSWNAWTLAKKLDRPSLALLRDTVAAYARGEPPPPIAQDHTLATEAAQPDDDALELRWTDDAATIVRRVRAAAPWPGAFTEIGGTVITLTEVRAATERRELLAALTCGEAFVRPDGVAVVRAKDAVVELLRGRVESTADGERDLDAREIATIVAAETGVTR